jgi:predicted Zn finger-like uncharacterized protein
MPIQITCPQCSAQFSLPDGLLGRDVKCTRCQRVFRAEAPGPAADAIPEVILVQAPDVVEPALVPQAIQSEPSPRQRSGPVPPPQRTPRKAAVPDESNQVWIIAVGIAAFLVIGGGITAWLAMSSSAPEPAPEEKVAAVKPVGPRDDQQPMMRDRAQQRDQRDQRDQRPGDQPPIRVEKPVVPPITTIKLPPLPDPIEIKPAPVQEERTVKLPDQAGGLRVGGGGRFLILYFPKLRQFGIFDANTAKIERFISVMEDNLLFAGGMTQLVVLAPGSGTIQRYNLLTGEQEYTGKMLLPGGNVEAFCMGHASAGPLLIGVANNGAHLYDIEKFKEIPLPQEVGFDNVPVERRLEGGFYWAGATGRVFGHTGNFGHPNGIKTVIFDKGEMVVPRGEHQGTWFVMPGPDDRHVYPGGHGVVSERVDKLDDVPFSMGDNSGFASHLYLPAHHGPFYLHAQTIDNFGQQANTPAIGTIRLFVLGDKQPIATYDKTAVCKYAWEGLKDFGIEHSMHLIPRAKLLVVVPESRRELRLYPADLDAALDKTGRDYLVFTSSAPGAFQKGKTFKYQAEAKVKKGPPTFRLASAPKGMTVDAAGLVSWDVPADYTGNRVNVILTAKDKAGQEVFHTFTLMAK